MNAEVRRQEAAVVQRAGDRPFDAAGLERQQRAQLRVAVLLDHEEDAVLGEERSTSSPNGNASRTRM